MGFIIKYIVLFVLAVIGLVVWMAVKDDKIAEAGRLLFFCALFWICAELRGPFATH